MSIPTAHRSESNTGFDSDMANQMTRKTIPMPLAEN
jgi:hypothetical protein